MHFLDLVFIYNFCFGGSFRDIRLLFGSNHRYENQTVNISTKKRSCSFSDIICNQINLNLKHFLITYNNIYNIDFNLKVAPIVWLRECKQFVCIPRSVVVLLWYVTYLNLEMNSLILSESLPRFEFHTWKSKFFSEIT